MTIKFIINTQSVTLDLPEDTPLLWVIRDELGFTGTKFGCGIGLYKFTNEPCQPS